MSLSHTGGCKMNVFTVVLSRLSNVDFSQTRPKIEGEAVSAGCLLLLLLFWLVCFVLFLIVCLCCFSDFVPPLLSTGMWPAVFLHVPLRPQATCGLSGTGNGAGSVDGSGWEGWRGRVPMNSSSLRSDPQRPKRPSTTATTTTLRRRGLRQRQATCCFRNKITKDSLRKATVEQISIPNSPSSYDSPVPPPCS